MPICGAKTHHGAGPPCKARALKGKKRCKFHGGRAVSYGWHPALLTGRAAWLERMKALQAAGLIDKLPMGPKAGMPRKPANIVAKAAALVDQTQSDLAAGKDTGMAQKFEEVVGLSLDKIKAGLVHKPRGKAAEKFNQLMRQAELGTRVLRVAQRSNDEMMRRKTDDRMLGLLERWAAAKAEPVPTLDLPATIGFDE